MIWCVDHDAQRRNLEIHALRCVGMDAKGYDSADSFWKDLQKECPELILMDAALSGVDPLVLSNGFACPAWQVRFRLSCRRKAPMNWM